MGGKKILVTGVSGFIGFHFCLRLLKRGDSIVGIDNLNDYYDVDLKSARLEQLKVYPNFHFQKIDLQDRDSIAELFSNITPYIVVNLAGQPGVRYSLTNPHAYVESNVVGFLNILEGCRNTLVEHLIYASSSSVYGANTHLPYSIHDNVDHPVSLYAATKKSNELMAHVYSHLYKIPTTGLRFFTVYGPWGRPDMAPSLFTKSILEGRPIDVFNNGKMRRDFTYVDDIVEGIIRVMDLKASSNDNWSSDRPDPSTSNAPYRLYNIGNNTSVEILEFIETIEKALNKKAIKRFLPQQPGDVINTYADVSDLENAVGFKPKTPLSLGISKFVEWYLSYYKV